MGSETSLGLGDSLSLSLSIPLPHSPERERERERENERQRPETHRENTPKALVHTWSKSLSFLTKIAIFKQAYWFTPVILATQEAEIGRITVRGQPGHKVWEILSQPIKVGCGISHCQSSYVGGRNGGLWT
jgi:hypothetical protein